MDTITGQHGQPNTYGPPRAITIIRRRVGLLEEVEAWIQFDRNTVHLLAGAADAVDRWYRQMAPLGKLPPDVTWTIHEPVDER